MTWQWVGASLLTGTVIADLPGFEPQFPLRRSLSTVDSASGVLHLDDSTASDWEAAVREGGAVLACYDDADPSRSIVWAGYVIDGDYSAAVDQIPINLQTFEACLDRAFVGNLIVSADQHRDDIIASLITAYFTPQTGIALNLQYTSGGGPTAPVLESQPDGYTNAAAVWPNTDNATVKTRIDEVCGQLGGEYTVEWAFTNSGQTLTPTLVFGTHIGKAAVQGFDPTVNFELPGSLIGVHQLRSYAADKGARRIVAYSTGSGSATPFSTTVVGPDDGRPIFEYRWQPAPSISPVRLQQYAQQAAAILNPGARPVTLTATTARMDGRRIGSDWRLGDDIGYRVPPSYVNEEGRTVKIRAFPNGLNGTGRVIAYELTDTTVSPILADKAVYTAPAAL